jgi:hypothetical protein
LRAGRPDLGRIYILPQVTLPWDQE